MTLIDVVTAFISAYVGGFLAGLTLGWFKSVLFSVLK